MDIIQHILYEGSLLNVLVVAVVLVVGMMAERWLMVSKSPLYYRLCIPITEQLSPIPRHPEGSGRTASVVWDAPRDGGVVFYWADPKRRGAPMGFHGMVLLTPTSRGFEVDVRWAPPLAPIVAFAWFGVFAGFEGLGWLAPAISALMICAVVLGYRALSLPIARELRWAFVRGEEDSAGG